MDESGLNDIELNNAGATSGAEFPTLSEQDEVFSKMQKLETENHKLQTEFNLQRAKMKDLFLQKETDYSKCQEEKQILQRELNELKSQLLLVDMKSQQELQRKDLKSQEEISSLQQLVQDTIEESAICKGELERLKDECQRLWLENKELREVLQQNQQESTSLGPQVLSQVKKTLARKLGGDSSAAGSSLHHFDDNSKKSGSKHAPEDVEFLRSIVFQLNEETKALKEKLREADGKLQTCHAGLTLSPTPCIIAAAKVNEQKTDQTSHDGKSINKSTSMDDLECTSCQSNEAKVQTLLKQQKEHEDKIVELQKSVEEANEDLAKEAALRKDLEDQWQTKREAYKAEVQSLRDKTNRNEKQLLDMQQKLLETKEETYKQLQRLTDDREAVNKHLETLQVDNDFLSGRYLATAEEIEAQCIDLPNTVEELQELMLRQRNELIQARVSSDYDKQKCVSLQDEIKLLRDQFTTLNEERRMYKKKMQTEIRSLEERLKEHLLTQQNHETTKVALERKETELNREISELRVEIIELQEKNEKLSLINAECRAKIMNLQTDLSTSEQVQKDFVQLSQTLQVALEELRNADTRVRWQDDDDISNCPKCSVYFTVTVRKIHCRHCGKIYCEKCLSKSVPCGLSKRLARVCDICHTLLKPNTPPYFSDDQLQTN